MLTNEGHGTAQYRLVTNDTLLGYTDDFNEAQKEAAAGSKGRRKKGVWIETLILPIREYAVFEHYQSGKRDIDYVALKNFYRQKSEGDPEQYVGRAEAAVILGWTPNKISVYRGRGVFPEPVLDLASGPVWTRGQIEEYKASKG